MPKPHHYQRGVIALIAAHPSFGSPAHSLDMCYPQAVGATESPVLWHSACWRYTETLGHTRVGHGCLQTSVTVGAACGCRLRDVHTAPDGFAGLRSLDAATRTWLEELNVDI